MKNLKLIFTPVLFVLALSACSDDSGSGGTDARSHGGNAREFRGDADLTQVNTNSASIAWGQIADFNSNSSSISFQSRIEDFLSPQLDSDEIGTVTSSFGSSGAGVYFYGDGISFVRTPSVDTDGFFQEQQNVFNSNTAELRIEVEDLINGERSVIPVHFNENGNGIGALTGSLLGRTNDNFNFIQLVFEDEFGKVSLAGVLNEASNGEIYYVGNVTYRNLSRLREGGTLQTVNESEKYLSDFSVNACEFFDFSGFSNINCD